MINSIFCFYGFLSSYKDVKPKINLERIALILTLFRLIFRLFDVEQSRTTNTAGWIMFVGMQTCAITVMACLLHLSSLNPPSSLFWIFTLILVGAGIGKAAYDPL